LNAAAIAAHPRLGGMVMGTNDLANDIGSRTAQHREPLMMALQTCVMAARTFGLPILDGVFNAFKDTAGLTDECEQGRDMGFDGKTLIHPAQIAAANAAFAPTDADIALARRRIAAFEEATRMGKGIAVVDGRIVEGLHIVTAKATLARAAVIAETESSCS
jgi:(3S)-malyl-CoA thioesterase